VIPDDFGEPVTVACGATLKSLPVRLAPAHGSVSPRGRVGDSDISCPVCGWLSEAVTSHPATSAMPAASPRRPPGTTTTAPIRLSGRTPPAESASPDHHRLVAGRLSAWGGAVAPPASPGGRSSVSRACCDRLRPNRALSRPGRVGDTPAGQEAQVAELHRPDPCACSSAASRRSNSAFSYMRLTARTRR